MKFFPIWFYVLKWVFRQLFRSLAAVEDMFVRPGLRNKRKPLRSSGRQSGTDAVCCWLRPCAEWIQCVAIELRKRWASLPNWSSAFWWPPIRRSAPRFRRFDLPLWPRRQRKRVPGHLSLVSNLHRQFSLTYPLIQGLAGKYLVVKGELSSV